MEYTTGHGGGGLVANMRSYATFLDAFLYGNLLSETARATLQEGSFQFHDSYTKNLQQFYSLGVIKTVERSNRDDSRSTILSHDGSNFGTQCINGIETRVADPMPLTFAVCVNVNGFETGFGDSSIADVPAASLLSDTLLEAVRAGSE